MVLGIREDLLRKYRIWGIRVFGGLWNWQFIIVGFFSYGKRIKMGAPSSL